MTDRANPEQYELWNGESGERWVADADLRDAVLAPIADLLLRRAAIQPGEAVLDIGCGCGVTTIAAADATGPTGTVVGLDISAPMLDVARRRADRADLHRVQFIHGDAQTQELGQTFALAISRFGTMFFAEPATAFTNIARHLRPGGRLCIATWQPRAANEWLVVPCAALVGYGTLPEAADAAAANVPGMFAQSDPDSVRALLAGAGFADVKSEPHTLALCFGAHVEEAVDYLVGAGPARDVLATIAPEQRETARAAVANVLAERQHDSRGVALGAAVWITTATAGE
jgi:ubiquinone/menaquinone biosynthesis C-methylase UbiE